MSGGRRVWRALDLLGSNGQRAWGTLGLISLFVMGHLIVTAEDSFPFWMGSLVWGSTGAREVYCTSLVIGESDCSSSMRQDEW